MSGVKFQEIKQRVGITTIFISARSSDKALDSQGKPLRN
jgi:hypothetical protein